MVFPPQYSSPPYYNDFEDTSDLDDWSIISGTAAGSTPSIVTGGINGSSLYLGTSASQGSEASLIYNLTVVTLSGESGTYYIGVRFKIDTSATTATGWSVNIVIMDSSGSEVVMGTLKSVFPAGYYLQIVVGGQTSSVSITFDPSYPYTLIVRRDVGGNVYVELYKYYGDYALVGSTSASASTFSEVATGLKISTYSGDLFVLFDDFAVNYNNPPIPIPESILTSITIIGVATVTVLYVYKKPM